MKQFRYISLRYRMFFACLIAALVPISLNGVMMRQFEITLEKQALEEGETSLKEASFKLDQLIMSCQGAIIIMEERNLIQYGKANDSKEVYLELYRIAENMLKGSKISVYGAKGDLQYSTDASLGNVTLPLDWGMLRKASTVNDMVFYTLQNELISNITPLMAVAKAQRDFDEEIQSYIEIAFSREVFEQVFSGLLSPQMNGYLVDEFGHIVYSSGISVTNKKQEIIRNICSIQTEESLIRQSESQYLMNQEKLSGYHIVLEQNRVFSKETLSVMRRISFFGIVISLGFCIGFGIIFSRYLFEPVSLINKAMKVVESGDLNVYLQSDRRDELGNLSRNFNHMTKNLKGYMDMVTKRNSELNESQIRLLQSQLNPHFLYNTLDMIKWMAKINSIPQIASIAENLAVILRQSVSKQQFVTLRDELDMVKSYLDIQQIRFSNKFKCIVEIDEKLEDCIVPKLMLQPLIENAIIHGFENEQRGEIRIHGRILGDYLELSVMDDGCGMPPMAVDKINSEEVKMVDGHLGLYNVNQILKLNYGAECGLRAFGKEAEGTTILVILPVSREENDA